MKKYNAVIVDPDMASRMRLKQATTSVVDFGHIYLLNNFLEADKFFVGENPVDVVFITGALDREKLAEFIRRAKMTKNGQDSAYVTVLKSQEEGNASVGSNMMLGSDGILCEPYSVDNLVAITHLAAKVKKERGEAREKAALSMIVKDIIAQIDLLAFLKTSNCDLGTSLKALRDLSEPLKSLSPESFKWYVEVAVNLFEEAPLPQRAFRTKVYAGASSRVKRKMEKKLLDEVTHKVPESK